MATTLNLALTDELRSFVDDQAGEGTLYSTPSEFVRAVLREKKESLDAGRVRDGILRGYEDAISGQTTSYSGSAKADHAAFRARRARAKE